MAVDNSLKLLLAHDSFEEANRVVSLLRNANYRAESKHVNKTEVLSKLLENKAWDLIIAQFDGNDVPVKSIFTTIRKLNLDTPVILITEEHDPSKIVEGLRFGAADVIPMDEDQRLLLVIARTLYDLEQRRRLRQSRRLYSDSESRCDRLLGSSIDAIAIVQEGTYLYTNDSYAQLFGYVNSEGMLCMPVIDTLATEEQENLKEYLRPIEADEEIPNKTINFTGMTGDEIPVPIEAKISKVDYQGEPALEFLIARDFLEGQGGTPIEISTNTSSSIGIQRNKVIELINATIRQAAQKHNTSALLYITIDRYISIQSEIGIQKVEELVAQLLEKIDTETKDNHSLNRFTEDSFIMVVPNTSADAGLMLASHLCEAVDSHMFELEDLTFSLTLGIGVSVVNEAVATPECCIDRARTALLDLYAEGNSTDFANGAKLSETGIGPTLAEDDVEGHAQLLLDEKQFELLYQPVIPLHGSQEEFYEVLMQVKPEALENDLPEDFIAKVFKTPTAIEIDHCVILEAIKALTEKLKSDPATRLFINISGHTIADEGFIPWLKTALKASGISPKQIIFQLREIDVARQFHHSVELIKELSKINGDVALSHFGLAIEPMKLLQKLSVNFVKFDSVIIEKAYEKEANMAEVENLISLLKSENENIIVPFVERANMIPTLWGCGVHYIQGHFLQPPTRVMNYDFSAEN
jgi:diguanylate cyclase (GGDEF)-like protein/PAS domain S-box-containing protein